MTKANAPVVHQMGEEGMLIELAPSLDMRANAGVIALRAAIEAAAWPGILETATTLKSVFLRFDPATLPHEDLRARLEALLATRDWAGAPLPQGRKLWRIPTVFGGDHGPQWEEAVALTGLSVEEALALISTTPLRVLTIGFSPGMPYLGQLPEVFDIPRKTELNPHVPAGGLAMAIRQFVLFPIGTQTGWRWIGQAAFEVFRKGRADAFPLNSGDELLFEPVSLMQYEDAMAVIETGAIAAQAEALP